MNRTYGAAALTLFLSVAVAACGGGGGGASLGNGTPAGPVVPPNNSAPNGGATSGSAPFSILIPTATSASSSTQRRPAYVSSATKSVAVFASLASATPPPTATTLANVGPGLPGCTAVTAGTSCTITVPAQYGAMTFTIKTYDNVLGTGNLLSQATFTQTIGPNQAAIPVTLSGIVADVQLSAPQYSYPAGGGSFPLTVNALDVNGAIIAGGGTYSSPITIVANDAADVTISPNPVTGPGQTVTVTYSASAPSVFTLRSHTAGLSENAEGVVAVSVAQAASTNYQAYALDQHSLTVFSFDAGAVGIPGARSHFSTPFLSYPNLLSVSPSGSIAVAQSFDPTFVLAQAGTVREISLALGYVEGIAFDPSTGGSTSGDLAVLNENSTQSIEFFRPDAGPTSTPIPGKSISGPALNSYSSAYGSSLGLDGSGNLYLLQGLSPYQVVEIAAGSSGSNVSALRTIPINPPNGGSPDSLAVAPDGTLAVSMTSQAGSNFIVDIQIFAPNAVTPSRTLTGGAIALAYDVGMTFAPDDTLYVASQSTVSAFAPTATGTTPPERSFSTALAGPTDLTGVGLGPASTSTPAATSVSGDMLNLAANRTWNYSGVSPGGPSTTLSLYNDPSPVDGNTGLVAFVLPMIASNALPANGGILAGAVGVADENDGYHALSFGSVSNDSFGLVPGAPLLVPSTLTLGQTFIPYPGITATVTGIATTSSAVQAACPGATLQANVAYDIGGAGVGVLSYAPGCGITKFTNQIGASFTLQTVESHPEVGQQSVVRHVLNASYGDTLRALWQHVLNGH